MRTAHRRVRGRPVLHDRAAGHRAPDLHPACWLRREVGRWVGGTYSINRTRVQVYSIETRHHYFLNHLINDNREAVRPYRDREAVR